MKRDPAAAAAEAILQRQAVYLYDIGKMAESDLREEWKCIAAKAVPDMLTHDFCKQALKEEFARRGIKP